VKEKNNSEKKQIHLTPPKFIYLFDFGVEPLTPTLYHTNPPPPLEQPLEFVRTQKPTNTYLIGRVACLGN